MAKTYVIYNTERPFQLGGRLIIKRIAVELISTTNDKLYIYCFGFYLVYHSQH